MGKNSHEWKILFAKSANFRFLRRYSINSIGVIIVLLVYEKPTYHINVDCQCGCLFAESH